MQLLLFLDSCGGIEGATKVIKIYYDIKRTSPEMFFNRDPENPKIQQCLQHQDYFHLPCTPDGSLLIFHRLSSSKASHYFLIELKLILVKCISPTPFMSNKNIAPSLGPFV